MTFLVTDNCIMCKHTDCVEVCPVDCFYEGPNFLAINPDECIDCGVCVPECPVDAIRSDRDPSIDAEFWTKINQTYSVKWPKITVAKEPLADHAHWRDKPNKIQMIEDWPKHD